MVKLKERSLFLQSKGTTIDNALDNLKKTLEDTAKEEGLIVPEDRLSAASLYQIGVRRITGGAYNICTSQKPYEAFEDAVLAANFKGGYNSEKHRVMIMAEFRLTPVQGTPSGPGRYVSAPIDLTGKLF